MSRFDRLFRKKPSSTPAPASAPEKPTAPSTVKVWDSYGRLGQIPREQWRTKVLPATFQKQWNDAAGLAQTLTAALSDGFYVESLDAAKQLHRIDPTPHRGATLLGVVLLQLKRFDDAAKLLSKDLKKHGPDGAVLTNLAKAQAGMGRSGQAEETLWTALELDPNQSNGLMWYAAIHRERSGEAAEIDALRRVSALAGSWRAQLWLARSALKRRDTGAALAFYRGVLELLKAVPADAFMQITGDLCNAGLVKEATDLCSSRFVAEQHGLPAGNNLVQAYVAQKDAANARRILEQLYAVPRPDWREHLLKLEHAVVQLDHGFGPVPEAQAMQVKMLVLDRPIWARDGGAFSRLLPSKRDDAPRIAFFAGSARSPDSEATQVPVSKPSDVVGRVTRSVPMFLAEQIHLRTEARTTFLLPWMASGGFVLAAQPWNLEVLGTLDPKPDFVVMAHIEATQEPWRAHWSVTRVIDESVTASWTQVIRPEDAATTLGEAVDRMLRELRAHVDVASASPPAWLAPPSGVQIGAYASGLEQALAVSCASEVPLNRRFLYGERSILDFLLDLSLRAPANAPARLLFLATIARESRLRSAIAKEYRSRVDRLQREHPLPPPADELAREVLGRIVWE
jgi:Flp pilus assembly protein TadD